MLRCFVLVDPTTLSSALREEASLKTWRTLFEAQIREQDRGIKQAEAHLDRNVLAGYVAVALASILGLSDGLFSTAVRPPVSTRSPFGANLSLGNRD